MEDAKIKVMLYANKFLFSKMSSFWIVLPVFALKDSMI